MESSAQKEFIGSDRAHDPEHCRHGPARAAGVHRSFNKAPDAAIAVLGESSRAAGYGRANASDNADSSRLICTAMRAGVDSPSDRASDAEAEGLEGQQASINGRADRADEPEHSLRMA